MTVKLPSFRFRRATSDGSPKRRRVLSHAERVARQKVAAEASGAVLFSIGVGCIGFVVAGVVLGIGLGCVVAGAALVAVGNV